MIELVRFPVCDATSINDYSLNKTYSEVVLRVCRCGGMPTTIPRDKTKDDGRCDTGLFDVVGFMCEHCGISARIHEAESAINAAESAAEDRIITKIDQNCLIFTHD